MSGKKRKNVQQADFKRLKAKVGKKALKAQNLTDTSFEAASLHVTGQAVDRSQHDSELLLSKRGRSLAELISQLGHPASAVRHSAMKGLGNVACNQSTSVLKPYLANLLTCCAKSLVDEEGGVRITGLSVFEHLIARFDEGTIAPFSPLLAAYINSALNSLESQMRIDGARAINILARSHPSLIEPFLGKFMPAFIRLLADKKVAGVHDDVVKGLVSLLRCSRAGFKAQTWSRRSGPPDHDLVYVSGGRTRNSLTPAARQQSPSGPQFPSLGLIDRFSPCPAHRHVDGDGAHARHIYDLLVQIRDAIVDVNQGTEFSEYPGKADIDGEKRLILLVEAVRLIWCRSKCSWVPDADPESKERISGISAQIVSMILEWLPDQSSIERETGDRSALATSICDTILTIAESTDSPGSNSPTCVQWIGPIRRHLLAVMHMAAQKDSTDVLCRLVLFLDRTNEFPEELVAILSRCQEVFVENADAALVRSESARKIILLVGALLAQHEYSLFTRGGEFDKILHSIVAQFPNYVFDWAADFCFESEAVLSSLIETARRSRDPSSCTLLSAFRADLGKIVLASKSAKQRNRSLSLFELWPPHLQRMYLQLIVLLGYTPADVLTGLADVCATAGHCSEGAPRDLRNEIVQSIHVVRKTIKMRDYLAFLVSSIGVPDRERIVRPNPCSLVRFDSANLDRLDSGLKCVSRCLLRCGSQRSFRMLIPQFLSWLEPRPDQWSSFLRYRSCVSIISILLNEMKATDDGASLSELAPASFDPLASASCQLLRFCSAPGGVAQSPQLLPPLLSLLQLEPGLLIPIFDELSTSGDVENSGCSALSGGLQIFLGLWNDLRIQDVATCEKLSERLGCLWVEHDGGMERQLIEKLSALLEAQVR